MTDSNDNFFLVLNPFQVCDGVIQSYLQQVSEQWDGWRTWRKVFGPLDLKEDPQPKGCRQEEDQGDQHVVVVGLTLSHHILGTSRHNLCTAM